MYLSHAIWAVALAGRASAATSLSASLCSQLGAVLSSSSEVECGAAPERWSEYAAPQPGAIVRVGAEDDVAKIVKQANKLDVAYLVQSGANGWASTFTLGHEGILIDVSALKDVRFNAARTEVSLQTGLRIEELVDAAWKNNARVATGTCNCVSVLGAGLGGGVGRGTGLYGLGSDQLLRVNLVTAAGEKLTVTPKSDPDLWWALGGAGANFGIVTSVVMKSYPVAQAKNTAWTGLLAYNSSQLEEVIEAIDELAFEPEMQLDFYFTGGQFLVLPFYLGSEATGRAKFASLLDIGPLADNTEVLPYNTWNAAGDAFCTKGGRKPTYAANLKTLDPKAWRSVWDEYLGFFERNPEASQTTLLTECYSTDKSLAIGSAQSAYAWRDIKCYAMVISWYTSPSLDNEAHDFGRKVRNYWNQSSGTKSFSAYINFAHGDESLGSIYGSSLSKLQQLKQKYDPKGKFNQWFPLS